MNHYYVENGHPVDLTRLASEPLNDKSYSLFHSSKVILCHDVFIHYGGGLLLVEREKEPVKKDMWPIGGAVKRGMTIEDSLRIKAKEECGLDIFDIREIGHGRTFFATEPFGHGKGTDTLNFAFFAKSEGKLKLDNLHSSPMVVTKEQYNENLKNKLHPYVRDFMGKAFRFI